MSYINLKVTSIVAEYPAYNIVARETNSHCFASGKYREVEYTDITAQDTLGLKRSRFYQHYSPGSVVSYAMKNNDCPIEAINEARARGHQLHWINACASVLTSHDRPQETYINVTIGMVVRFEGQLFTIEDAPNNNLSLKPYVFVD